MANKNTTATANETNNEKKVIILNKPFLGGWLDEEGRIGHEIIDFFLADNDRYYVYNNPRGACPNDIWVGDSEKNDYGLDRTDDEQYVAKYMVLTSDAHATDDDRKNNFETKKSQPKDFKILYVIKLKEKIHRFNNGKDEVKGLKAGQGKFENIKPTKNYPKSVSKIITDEGITYNGQALNEIYGEDESLYLTFEAEAIYKVKEDETLLFEPKKYNFARNKGYIYNDTLTDDYNNLIRRLEDEIDKINNNKSDSKLEKMELKRLPDADVGKYHVEKTFLDLIGSTDKEQAFTNMLHALLNDNEIFKKFCETFRDNGSDFSKDEVFKIEREKKVNGGRMDISGESKSQKVIIENKIYSGLNGKKKDKKISQLSVYYDWGIKDDKGKKLRFSPLCFITAPDFRIAHIKAEIKEYDRIMAENDVFHFIPYSEIVKFLNENQDLLKRNKLISLLFDQILNAFKNWSYKDKQDLYASMFLAATEEANKRKC